MYANKIKITSEQWKEQHLLVCVINQFEKCWFDGEK